VKHFMFLTYGFQKPTFEAVQAWGNWFSEISDSVIEKGRFPRGREITHAGAEDLSFGPESITGYVIISAESFEAASLLAEMNPFVSSIRIYELAAG